MTLVKDPFDEHVPEQSDIKSDADFYKQFDEVFERNSKWSQVIPVPRLGNEKTPLREVERFYDFWSDLSLTSHQNL